MNNMSQLDYETFHGTLKRHYHVKNTKLVHNAFVIIKQCHVFQIYFFILTWKRPIRF